MFNQCPSWSLCYLGYYTYRFQMNRALLREEWRIPSEQLQCGRPTGFGSSARVSPYMNASVGSMQRLAASSLTLQSVHNSCQTASWQGLTVSLRWLGLYRTSSLKRSTKKELIRLKFYVDHANVLKLYGVGEVDRRPFLVSEICPKGTLRDVIVKERFRLDVTFQFSLANDIAAGMEYLHKCDLLHGNLSCVTCQVDSRWTAKVADWEYYRLSRAQKEKSMQVHDFFQCFSIMRPGADAPFTNELFTVP